MKVVADTQSIYWYLTNPERLSDRALEALGEAENTESVIVSTWTMPELWMVATRKRGPGAISTASYELVRAVLLDPDIAVDVEPFGTEMWPHFEVVSAVLRDPFDSAIVATARALGVDLVSSDGPIATSQTVTVIW